MRMSFAERAALGLLGLSAQRPVTLAEAREQAQRLSLSFDRARNVKKYRT